MTRRISTLVATVLFALGPATACGADQHSSTRTLPPFGPGPVIPAAPAAHATNALALKLLPRLAGQGNVVFSPYSIEAALAMVGQGAGGTTASEMGHVLGGAQPSTLAGPNLALSNALRASVTAPSGTPSSQVAQLLIANGLWVQQGLPLEDPFTTTLSHDFGAALQTVDFGGDVTAARQAINSWIASHTGQLIKNLMGPDAITPQTLLVLANAIYLKARWADPFEKSATAPAPFTTAAGDTVRTPFMSQSQTNLRYARGKGYVAVEEPYLNSQLSMLAVMPAQGTIGAFERGLTPTALNRLTGALNSRLVDLRMPKLRLAIKTDLVDTLSRLGMPTAFSDAADFSGITRGPSLKIQAVEHGADLRINEAGTVAAAATGISLEPTAVAPGQAVHVTLDHPYLLFLRDDSTGAILFAARVADPTLS